MITTVLLSIIVQVCFCGEDFKPDRFHLVNHKSFGNGVTSNWMFRGNSPTINDTFAYDTLVEYMNIRANQSNLTFPSTFYFIDISLLNPGNIPTWEIEQEFWKKHMNDTLFGEIINWYPSAIQSITPPNELSIAEQIEYCKSQYLWEIDTMPIRINKTQNIFLNKRNDNLSISIYIHCEAGCDRTGEFIADYRLMYIDNNITTDYDLDCTECGRCPNYWSTTSIEWFCLCHQFGTLQPKLAFGNCTDIANCTYGGDCTPIH